MIDASACAQLCADVYTRADGWDHRWTANNVVVAHKRIGDVDAIVSRGSLAAVDWLRDLDSLIVHHAKLGYVHAGMSRYCDDVYAEILDAVGDKVALIGHSLGAARTMYQGGLFAKAGRPAQQITVFGCPRPGGEELRDILCMSGTHIESYRNGRDPVTFVPFVPGIFCHVVEPTVLHGGADAADASIFREHHCSRYLIGLETLATAA